MKLLIISDTHLTNEFNERKFKFLYNLINNYDKIIINGDFWSGYSITFDAFISSKWNKLFPLLKSKDTTYIYGNHDREEWCDKRVELFSNKQTVQEIINIGDTKYIVEHGNTLVPRDSIKNPIFVKINRLLKIDKLIRYPIEKWIIKTFGIKTYARVTKNLNEIIKKYARVNLKDNEILIVGHTHRAEKDLNDRVIIGGIINYGTATYITIEGNNINLIEEIY